MIHYDATFSPCGRYRYDLQRVWSWESGRTVIFVMLNPSTADAAKDDPTIRRCISFAKREGAGRLAVVNLFAFRATSPDAMKKADDPIGPDNDHWLRLYARPNNLMVCGWGVHGAFNNRAHAVLKLLREYTTPMCLGTTKGGHPRHPLYVKGETPLEVLK